MDSQRVGLAVSVAVSRSWCEMGEQDLVDFVVVYYVRARSFGRL